LDCVPISWETLYSLLVASQRTPPIPWYWAVVYLICNNLDKKHHLSAIWCHARVFSNNLMSLQVSSKRYQQCCLSSFISLVCFVFRWLHCICFSRNGLFWSQSKSSYCSLGNSTGPCKFKWERWDSVCDIVWYLVFLF
jgi:hypothetical protein